MRHARLSILACLLALAAACADEAPPPGGGGGGGGDGIVGAGGSGGGGGGPSEAEQIQALCERACARLATCGDPGAACVEDCLAAPAPAGVFEPCVACLESISCVGAPLACHQGAACDMAWDLRVTGAGLEAHEGRTARVLVVEAVPGELWVDFARDVRIVDGGFDLEFVGGLPAWQMPFDVVVLVDANDDDLCDGAGGDLAFRLPVGIPTGDAHVRVAGDAPIEADACAFWSVVEPRIVLAGAGFDVEEGRWAIAAPVWYGDDFLTIGAYAVGQVEGGTFRFELGDFGDYVDELAVGSELVAAWMIDLDGDWICSDADAGGTGPIPPTPRGFEQRVEASPTAPGTAPCHLLRGLGHDIRLEGGGYDGWEGDAFRVAILDGARTVAWDEGIVEEGRVEASFPRAGVPGAAYDAVLWIDADGDRVCAPDVDFLFAWDVEMGAGALLVEAPFPGAAADSSRCAPFDLRSKGKGR